MKGFVMKVEYGKLSSHFLIAALLATGTTTGYLNYHQPVISANSMSDSLEITQTQAVNFIDQQSGKIVGHQQLVLQKNDRTFASDAKLKLPSGYKRSDNFVYDLSGSNSQNTHYDFDKNGKVTWNIFVSKDTDEQESGTDAKTITSTTTKHNDDGTTTITTTVTTTTGSKSSTKTSNAADTSSEGSTLDPDENDSSSSTSQAKSSMVSSQKDTNSGSVTKMIEPNASIQASSSTQISKANSANSVPTTDSSNNNSTASSNNGSTNGEGATSASILEPNGSSSNKPATSSSAANSSGASSANGGATGNVANSSSGSTNTPNGNGQSSQTLPQTNADQATPAAEQTIGLGLAGILAGIGLGNLIKKHRKNQAESK